LRRTTGFRAAAAALVILGLAAATAAGTYAARSSDGNSKGKHRSIAMRDDCDPTDPTWAEVGGCLRKKGNVTRAEFMAELSSPLSPHTVVGHQAWRNTPAYAVVEEGTTLRVKNTGGRVHTFTKVAEFGGGTGPPFLNTGLTLAPECPLGIPVLPGEATRISGLVAGDHLFQCCIHPWMRAQVTVTPKRGKGGDDDDDDNGHHHHHH
jgi:hypothetical protein